MIKCDEGALNGRGPHTQHLAISLGLFGAGFAFLAGALAQIGPIVALGWCTQQKGPGARAECYTNGFAAVAVGLFAGFSGVYAIRKSYAEYQVAQGN